MLRRQVGAVGGALAALVMAGLVVPGLGPAAADDGAGSGNGDIWAEADEQLDYDSSGDTDSGDTDSDGSSDTDSSTVLSGGGDECSDDSSITLALAGFGNCAWAPGVDVGDPAAPPVVPVVDAREEAEEAFDRLPLQTANVQLAPGPPLPTYPNLETWIWVPEEQWQTLTLSVTAGSTTVHVEARPVRLDIDSGERDQMKYSATSIDPTFSCSGPGRAWDESLGDDAETSCGYTYMTTSSHNPAGGNRYRLTASIVYEGSWTCVGQCTEDGGSLGEVSAPSGTQAVSVQERQSVVVGG